MPDTCYAPDSSHSVTALIGEIAAGDRAACGPLWEAYFPKLVAAVRARLRAAGVVFADGEDAALSALDSFFERAKAGRFPQLDNRDDLWSLLLTIVTRKAVGLIRREGTKKRGGGRVVREADLLAGAVGAGPDPAEVEEHAEEVARLLGHLGGGELRRVAVWKMDGYSNEEIARMLGRALATVERKLARIRAIWEKERGAD